MRKLVLEEGPKRNWGTVPYCPQHRGCEHGLYMVREGAVVGL